MENDLLDSVIDCESDEPKPKRQKIITPPPPPIECEEDESKKVVINEEVSEVSSNCSNTKIIEDTPEKSENNNSLKDDTLNTLPHSENFNDLKELEESESDVTEKLIKTDENEKEGDINDKDDSKEKNKTKEKPKTEQKAEDDEIAIVDFVKNSKSNRKRKQANLRKNIREVLSNEQLDAKTKEARKEEEERRERFMKMQMNYQQRNPSAASGPVKDFSFSSFDDLAKKIKKNFITVNASPDSTDSSIRFIPKKINCNEEIVLSSDSENEEEVNVNRNIDPSASSSFNNLNHRPVFQTNGGLVINKINNENEQSKDDDDGMIKKKDEISESDDDDCIVLSPNTYVNDTETVNEDINNVPDEFGRVLVNIGHPDEESDIFLPSSMSSYIKPHQIAGIRFLYNNVIENMSRYNESNGFGCILAHSMGLGKTFQAVAFCDIFLRYTNAKCVLIIVPINTIQNWQSEFLKWLPPSSQSSSSNKTKTKNSSKKNLKSTLNEVSEDSKNENMLNNESVPVSVKEEKEQGSINDIDPSSKKVSLFLLNETVKTLKAREKIIKEWSGNGGILLLGYEMYRMLALKKLKRSGKKAQNDKLIDLTETAVEEESLENIFKYLVDPGPELVICDEGHRIKNSGASISQALKAIKTRRRVVLTGYPLQNNLMEYWCMIDFIRPNFLGTKAEFSICFEKPILNGQCADSTSTDKKLMRYRSYVLHSQLEGFVQRRSHLVLKQNLPPKTEWVFLVKMTKAQTLLYKEFINYLRKNMENATSSTNPIKAFAVCCKIWNHPDALYNVIQKKVSDEKSILDDLDLDEVRIKRAQKQTGELPSISSRITLSNSDNSIKLDWANYVFSAIKYTPGILENGVKFELLIEIIKETVLIGDKLLVFSQSLLTLDLIEMYLSKTFNWNKGSDYFRLDGRTSGLEREKLINEFNSNKNTHVFLVSTRAGSLGINLIGANRVCVFDASWNPCHDTQAVCRVYRYGQTKPCHIYRFVTDGTLERKIYDRQINKRGMSDRVVDEMNPESHLTYKEVSSYLVLSHEQLDKLQETQLTIEHEKFDDEVMKKIIIDYSSKITKEPFEHESLLIDRKDKKLTLAEKRLAHKGYEIEKKNNSNGSSGGFSYNRPSYAAYYPKYGFSGGSAITDLTTNSSNTNTNLNSNYHSSSSSSSPLSSFGSFSNFMNPFNSLGQNFGSRHNDLFSSDLFNKSIDNFCSMRYSDNFPVENLVKSGLTCQPYFLSADGYLIDPNCSSSNGTYLRRGEKILVIKSSKGVYFRLSNKKIIAVRRSTNPDSIQPQRPFSKEELHLLVSSFVKTPAQILEQRRKMSAYRQYLAEKETLHNNNRQQSSSSSTTNQNLQFTNYKNNSGGNVMECKAWKNANGEKDSISSSNTDSLSLSSLLNQESTYSIRNKGDNTLPSFSDELLNNRHSASEDPLFNYPSSSSNNSGINSNNQLMLGSQSSNSNRRPFDMGLVNTVNSQSQVSQPSASRSFSALENLTYSVASSPIFDGILKRSNEDSMIMMEQNRTTNSFNNRKSLFDSNSNNSQGQGCPSSSSPWNRSDNNSNWRESNSMPLQSFSQLKSNLRQSSSSLYSQNHNQNISNNLNINGSGIGSENFDNNGILNSRENDFDLHHLNLNSSSKDQLFDYLQHDHTDLLNIRKNSELSSMLQNMITESFASTSPDLPSSNLSNNNNNNTFSNSCSEEIIDQDNFINNNNSQNIHRPPSLSGLDMPDLNF